MSFYSSDSSRNPRTTPVFRPSGTLCLISGILLLGISLFLFFTAPDRRFERFLDSHLEKELAKDGLTLHYTLADPSEYGIKEPPRTLEVYSLAGEQAAVSEHIEDKEVLLGFNRSALRPENQITYDILLYTLECEIAGAPYLYFEEPLTFVSGMHVELPILLSEYAMRDSAEVKDYLALLESVPGYLEGLLAFEEEKAAEGTFMSSYALKEVLKQCQSVLTAESLQTETNLLQTGFRSRLEKLLEKKQISQTQFDAFLKENNRILTEEVLPAYEKLTHGLYNLKNYAGASQGLCYSESAGAKAAQTGKEEPLSALQEAKTGKDYYRYLIKRETGSDMSPEEMMTLLEENFLADYSALMSLYNESGEDGDKNKAFTLDTIHPVESTEDYAFILEDLKNKCFLWFPAVQEELQTEVLPVEKGLSDYVSPAFYLIPPLDLYDENVIYLNEPENTDDLSLYTTLAHEGYPGHLYQTTYFYGLLADGMYHPVRSILQFPGYTEGYATYAEFLSYEYAESYADATAMEIERLNRRLWLSLYAMLDLSIHFYGYDNEDTYQCLASFGIDDRRAAGEVYEYIVNAPANYLTYYIGCLETERCKELARVAWKEDYSDMRFHSFFLGLGPAPFPYIRENISNSPDFLQF